MSRFVVTENDIDLFVVKGKVTDNLTRAKMTDLEALKHVLACANIQETDEDDYEAMELVLALIERVEKAASETG